MASAPVLHIKDGIATITLNRPAQRNRLENEDLQTLLAHFQQVNADLGVRVLVLTANTQGQPKPVFCAGYDIGGFNEQGQGAMSFEQVPEALAVLRPITLCALNGSVYGGATDLVLACDLRIASTQARMGLPEINLGVLAGAGGCTRLPRTVPAALAAEMILTGQPINAQRCLEAGLVSRVVEPAALLDTVFDLAQTIAARAPKALRACTALLRRPRFEELNDALAQERQAFADLLLTQDAQVGIRAFTEKRPPVYRNA